MYPHVSVLTETWLSATISTDSLYAADQYTVCRADGPMSTSGCRRAGGVLIVERKPYTCQVDKIIADSHTQMRILKITDPSGHQFQVTGLYRSPSQSRLNSYTI
ncbi:hypothetical protein DPMN_047727 [Dreissena polymorpha]|uniref:Uncharacterized protein n=1 Tax=Dreissena polymorpha TaxID=45954 RepID=A0A9D4I1N7_DREPO|nr:hypothetical protein DPMN_047727 [Dreissena polymorpha]